MCHQVSLLNICNNTLFNRLFSKMNSVNILQIKMHIVLFDDYRFASEFFKEPYRGYGGSVCAVFHKLKQSECSDPFRPAAEQFDGQGSYGNGGAMRIAPAALYGYNLSEERLNVSTTVFRLPDSIGLQHASVASHSATT